MKHKKVELITRYVAGRRRDERFTEISLKSRLEEVMDVLHGSATELAFGDLRSGEVTRENLRTVKDTYAINLARDTGLLDSL